MVALYHTCPSSNWRVSQAGQINRYGDTMDVQDRRWIRRPREQRMRYGVGEDPEP